MGKYIRAAAVAVLFASPLVVPVISSGCASLKPPVQLSPIGDIAWHARTAIHTTETLQQIAIDGEHAGTISTADAETIVKATTVAEQAGVDLSKALRAGVSEKTARAQAVAAFKTALVGLPQRLSPNTQKLVQPYVTAVLTLLTVFE